MLPTLFIAPFLFLSPPPCLEVSPRVFDCSDPRTRLRASELTYTTPERVVVATVTGYTSEVGQTDDSPAIGAMGTDIWEMYQRGEWTCASNDHAFGTRLRLQYLGECVVRDRMNKRYTGTGRVDYFFGKDTKAALQWGKRLVSVTVLQ